MGEALVSGALSANASRDADQVRSYIDDLIANNLLDVDGDGNQDALSDGIITVRYLFGDAFAGNTLMAGAISGGATRTEHTEIRAFLAARTSQ